MDMGYGDFSYLMLAMVHQWENPTKGVLGGGNKSCYLDNNPSTLSFQFSCEYRVKLKVIALAGGCRKSGNSIVTPIGRVGVYKLPDHHHGQVHFSKTNLDPPWIRLDLSHVNIYDSEWGVGGVEDSHNIVRGWA